MTKYTFKDSRYEKSPYLGFVQADDEERDLHFHGKLFISEDGSLFLEKFLSGRVGKYKFQCLDFAEDTILFRGSGRGRKPDSAIKLMKSFVSEVYACTRTVALFTDI